MTAKLEEKNPIKEEKQKTSTDTRELVMSPAVNVYETEAEAIFVVDLPGVKEEDLDISLEKGMLTIEGKLYLSKPSEFKKEFNDLRVDAFKRKFSLGKMVDAERAVAKFRNGQLRLTLPKEEPQRKKISIAKDV